MQVKRGLTPDEAQTALVAFAPEGGWATYAGEMPGLVAVDRGSDWLASEASWLTGAEAFNAAGASLALRVGDEGLDLTLVALDPSALPNSEGLMLLVHETSLLAHEAWQHALRYAIGWREVFAESGSGHLAPVISRLIGWGSKGHRR